MQTKVMQTKAYPLLKGSAGFTLAEILVSMGLAVVIGFGAAYLMLDTYRMGTSAAVQTDMDQSHILATQVARNSKNVEAWMTNNAALGGPALLTDAQRKCFSRTQETGVDCTAVWLNGAGIELVGARKSWKSGGFDVTSTVSVSATCLYTSCSYLVVEVATKLEKDGVEVDSSSIGGSRTRRTIFQVPSYMFGVNQQLRFDCSNLSGLRRIITGVDGAIKDARCDTLQLMKTCTANGPAGGFIANASSCIPLENQQKCPLGYSVAGLLKPDGGSNANCVSPVTRYLAALAATCKSGDAQTLNGCVSEASYNALLAQGFVPTESIEPCQFSCSTPGEIPLCKKLQCPL